MIINKREMIWVVKFSLLLLIITTIPYIAGYFFQGSEWRFTGFVFGVDDGNTYIAKMIRGSYGDWLLRSPYTSFPQNGVLAFISYMLIGKLASGKAIHEQMVALFQIYRWVAVFFCNVAVYAFISRFYEEIRLRRRALVIISAGGGLGWLVFFGVRFLSYAGMPLEFYSPEAFGFLMEYGLPHLLIARGLLFICLTCFLVFLRSTQKKWAILGGASLFISCFFQPQTPAIAWGVMVCASAVIIFIKRNQFIGNKLEIRNFIINAIWFFALPAPLFLYIAISYINDPYFMKFTGQNIITSPPAWDWLISFGWVLMFAILGFIKQRKILSEEKILIIVWLAIFPIMIYAPYNLQRRLAEGIWVILVIAAINGINSSGRFVAKLGWVGLFSGFLVTGALLIGSLNSILHPAKPVYRITSEVDVFNHLREIAQPYDVVLAPLDISNALPAWSPLRVVIGHGPESVNYQPLLVRMEEFFGNSQLSKENISFLDETDVKYILIPAGQEKTKTLDAETKYFNRVFKNDSFIVFEYNLNH